MGNNFLTTFIFPFKFEQKKGRVDLGHAREVLKKALNNVWEPDEFKITDGNGQCSTNRYNEFYYFHPFVRDVLLSRPDDQDVACFSRSDYDKLTLKYEMDGNSESVIAKINSISLHLFDVGVGFLSIETEKDKDIDFEKLLIYNDLTRRVYPPFLKENMVNLDSIKTDTILPTEITLSRLEANDQSKRRQPVTEKFENDSLTKCLKESKPFLSNIVQELLNPFQFRANTKEEDRAMDVIYYTPFTDDRMFVISWFVPDPKTEKDKKIEGVVSNAETGSASKPIYGGYATTKTAPKAYSYKGSPEWYKFIFVDGKDKGIHNTEMMEKLIDRHTYARHVEDGTLFGMSRYSFVCLCGASKNGVEPEIIKGHMQSMYFRMAILVILQRAILLKFSEKIGEIAKDFDGNTVIDRASELHGDFIKYINKYRTLEASPQEQGIEIYNQWMEICDIERLFQEAQREISDMAEYIENKIESNRNENMSMITYLGVPLAAIGLILAFWQTFSLGQRPCLGIIMCLIGAVLAGFLVFLFPHLMRRVKRWKKHWKP